MTGRHIVLISLALSVFAAAWGVVLLAGTPLPEIGSADLLNKNHSEIDAQGLRSMTGTGDPERQPAALPWIDNVVAEVEGQLALNKPDAAISTINDVYNQASAAELERLKQVVLRHAEQLSRTGNGLSASALLESYATAFNDVDAWRGLGTVSYQLENWSTALTAFSRASSMEYQPEQLAATLKALVRTAAYVRAPMERQGDELGILAMYQRLYELQPDHARFQLELAQSHLRLGDTAAARPLLENLQYDVELGAIARQKLAKLEADAKSSDAGARQDNEELGILSSYVDIIVPLTPSGTGYLVDISINSRPQRLLLDTGASVTALTTQAIQNLNLQATGRYLQLSTANGTIRSQLFRADRVQIGRLTIPVLLVAEIDMQQSNGVQGLLGTDLLTQLGDNYSYLIDNRNNALVFRKK